MSESGRTAPPPPQKLERRLGAHPKGYSRLMGEEEEATLRTLTSHRKVIDSLIARHRGRIVGTAGDSVLAEFASVVDAVQCTVVIQQTLKAENARLPAERRMEFRIGINLGDVMVEGEQIYGDGVNIAARLEALAEAGGVCISGVGYDQVKHKLALQSEELGEQVVKTSPSRCGCGAWGWTRQRRPWPNRLCFDKERRSGGASLHREVPSSVGWALPTAPGWW